MPTHMIVVAGPKGGTGKSTTASNLLVAARMAGVDAVGVDLDPQGSLMTWSQDRAGLAVQPAVTVVPGQLPDWRDAVATAPSRVAVLDLPPGLGTQADAEALHELARAARLVVVPALPEGPSVRKLADVGAALKRTGGDVVFLMNKVIAGRTITEDARAYLAASAELVPVEIPMRDSIHRAMDSGLSVVENADFGGCTQYRELWRFVVARLRLDTAEAA
jgi:chromosome partitioning protein